MTQEPLRHVSPASLSRANEANFEAAVAAWARAYGGEVSDEPDLLWCAVGVPAAGLNHAVRARLTPQTLDARIEWVKARAQTLQVPFYWEISPSTQPAGLGDHLLRHGLTDVGEDPAMALLLAQLPRALGAPEGVAIEWVQDRASLAQWARTFCAGMEVPAAVATVLEPAIARDALGEAAAIRYYLARLDGEPVATAMLVQAGGVAGIYAVATIERARRRGIGAAVTLAPLLDARARGYVAAVLQSSEMGYAVYARMGFVEQFRYHSYRFQPE
jgi:GNAT superfamily N-acetyltransferase